MSNARKPCCGLIRTKKGDRSLVAILTDPAGTVAQEFLAEVRAAQPHLYATMEDEDLIPKMVAMITGMPQECPECGHRATR